ncbi:hypothetical protein AALO_G00179160 [Alosa alosa]|uniref:Uncharacterized protein n=1 Tax=Alosa alosa TaxID=278164 RepID=A0AAV6GF41_9TELE|nr:interferon lambda receptor 1 [Alosa alosa]KAG5271391.1 hypothetical protein AALO_G00179160 [Alosa alosa]
MSVCVCVCVYAGCPSSAHTKLPQLLDMWLLAFLVLAFCSSGHANTVKVYFQSENFHNVLHWDKYSPDNHSQLYSVEYTLYGSGQVFKPKNECQDITTLSCDLSRETPMSARDDQYIAQVKVGGKVIGQTERFWPFIKSELGAPDVAVTLNASVMTVRVELPMLPNNKSLRKILPKPPFYTLILTHNKSGEAITQEQTNTTELFVISKLHRDTEYCGSVTYNIDDLKRRPQSKAFTFCKTFSEPVKPTSFLFLLPAGTVLLLLVALPLLVWRLLIGRKGATPESLNFVDITPTPLATSEKTNISNLELQPEEFTNVVVVTPDKKIGSTSKYEGYAPQDTHPQPWHCQTYNTQQMAPPEDSQGSALSSPTYSVVVRADVHNSSEDESSPTSFPVSGRPLAPGSHLHGHQKGEAGEGDPQSPQSGPLKLQISSDGTLQLPFLHHLPRAIGDCDPQEEISEQTALLSVQPETGGPGEQSLYLPHLSSLTVWGSQEEELEACATNTYISNEVISSPQGITPYRPVQEQFYLGPLASTSQTNYKQNWVPPVVLESFNGPGVSLQSAWVNPAEGEQQGDEEEEAHKELYLKGWKLQIQSSE